jgi:UDP:flavonoid glycosyltransferase YjiC (YdhE family)
MPAGLTLPRWAPPPVKSMYWRLLDGAVVLLIGRELNRLRESLELPPVRQVFNWWTSPQLILGFFPDWYGKPQSDWPPHLRLCGFPSFDGTATSELAPGVDAFCKSGSPPIAFTFGTGMMHASHLFAMAVEACRLLGARGILLTRHASQLPVQLPAFMRSFDFAPFSRLFPLCRAIVHHGGIGTISKALAAGTPQLVMPIAYDQLDNAKRILRLGVGSYLKPGRATAHRLAEALKDVTTADLKSQCTALASRFSDQDAFEDAATLLERLASEHIGASRTVHSPL